MRFIQSWFNSQERKKKKALGIWGEAARSPWESSDQGKDKRKEQT